MQKKLPHEKYVRKGFWLQPEVAKVIEKEAKKASKIEKKKITESQLANQALRETYL